MMLAAVLVAIKSTPYKIEKDFLAKLKQKIKKIPTSKTVVEIFCSKKQKSNE